MVGNLTPAAGRAGVAQMIQARPLRVTASVPAPTSQAFPKGLSGFVQGARLERGRVGGKME